MSEQLLYIHNIGRLVTPRARDMDNSNRPVWDIANAAMLIRDGRIAEVKSEKDFAAGIPADAMQFDAKGQLAIPGLVDCHTHPVFVGNRADEFHARNAGKSYQEIAATGGGIQATARKVRAAKIEQIVTESLPRFDRSLMSGVTTIEAKSGYGLDWGTELKLLRVLEIVTGETPQRVQRTLLIHAVPEAASADRDGFVQEVIRQWFPHVSDCRLATAVDVFCENGAFTVDESREILSAAKESGLHLTIHANQFGHSGGAKLAAELGARSADHLEYLNDEEIRLLTEAGVVGVLLPASVFYLGSNPYPPARRMIDSGMRVAIATDMNPGSAMTESLPLSMTIAAIYCKMTPNELLWATTLDPARMLGMDSTVGSLEPGKRADIALYNVPDISSLSYHFGDLRSSAVFIDGVIAWEDRDSSPRY